MDREVDTESTLLAGELPAVNGCCRKGETFFFEEVATGRSHIVPVHGTDAH